jgi:hypothetical protein
MIRVELYCAVRSERFVTCKLLVILSVIAGLAIGSPATFAHHGTSDYDLNITLSLHGTVTQFQFVNPHSFLSITVKNDQGKDEEWLGELQSPGMLYRRGHWNKDTVKPGDQVIMVGSPAKNGSKSMIVRKVVTADGQEYPSS